MRLLFVAAMLGACGGGDAAPDVLVIDPTVVDVLVLAAGAPVAARDVTVITSDGITKTIKTDATGHAFAMFGATASSATVYSDSKTSEGRYTMQGAVLGDRVCLGCAYTTTTEGCAELPKVTSLSKNGQGWTWQITGAQPYAGMVITWTSTGVNGGGRIVSPPGSNSASTNGSANIRVELLVREDVPTYDVMRSLTPTTWARTPFCASTAAKP